MTKVDPNVRLTSVVPPPKMTAASLAFVIRSPLVSSWSIGRNGKIKALCSCLSWPHGLFSALDNRHSGQRRGYQVVSDTTSKAIRLPFAIVKIAAGGSTAKSYRLASSKSVTGKQTQYRKPWHDPSFMEKCSPETVEQWLVSLLKSTNNKGGSSDTHGGNTDADSIAYLRVLEAFAKSKIGGAPQKAEYWIGRLEKHYAHVANDYLRNETPSFGSVESGDLLSSSSSSTFEPTKNDTGMQKSSSFANLIAARKALNNQSSQTGQSSNHMNIMNGTDSKDASIVRSLQPTVDCYNAVIDAWSNDSDKVSVVRARRWLSKLESGIECPFPLNHPLYSNLKPDARSYDLYLHSCSRGIGRQHRQHKERAEEAEELLRFRISNDAPLSIRPTTESYNYCLRAWTRCRKEISVADKVMRLVREMEAIQRDYMQSQKDYTVSEASSWKEHISPNTKTYTMAIDAWVVVAGIKAKKKSYEQLITNKRRHTDDGENQFIDDGTEEMENAAAILKYIHTLESAGRADVNASVIGYNTILSGYARLSSSTRPEIPLKSEAILREMMESCMNGKKHTSPDVVSFNAVIKAWAATGRPNSAARCEWWLRRMIKESDNIVDEDEDTVPSVPKPDVNTYNLVMDAYLQLGDPKGVQNLLLEMDASDSVSPNSESFSKVIRAWLHDEMNNHQQQGLPGLSCENAFYWLKELLERERAGAPNLGSAPDLYQSILKTAARTHSRQDNLLSVGQATFWVSQMSIWYSSLLLI